MTENDREGGGEATNVPSQTGDESQRHSRSFQLYYTNSLQSELISEQMQTAVDTCMCHCHRIIPLIISASKTKEKHLDHICDYWHFSVTTLCNWKKSHYNI